MIERAGIMDVIGLASQRDTCLVLPTLRHAIALWSRYREALADRHNHNVKASKTAVVMLSTRTVLRLWTPYSRDPTQPMDWEINRRGFELISPYSRSDLGV